MSDHPSVPDEGAVDPIRRAAQYATLVHARIAEVLRGIEPMDAFYGMMAYHFGLVDQQFAQISARAGKSLRPALCLLMIESLGGTIDSSLDLAAGIEVLHNFSLVHDDIEDRSPTRRGRPTVWSIWGDPQAINAGDGLFAIAHQLWLSAPIALAEPRAFVEMLISLERAILTLCEGQFLDMRGEGKINTTSDDYLTMIHKKTASLIGESAWLGARVITSDPDVLAAARQFGSELGVAFQIRDDLLGIWGDEHETGKSASSDISTRKMTLPVILALEHAPEEMHAELAGIYGASAGNDDDEIKVKSILERTGARQRTIDVEDLHWHSAMRALDSLPISEAWREGLTRFARLFVARRS